ncbi:hypothetical protein FBU59_000377 [Linderina macrospora]|uniref:Uncharacterized protein n=1 Tax=Linderina macrospora TaxID=4868 RepID=A0ACC1JGS5_9FUNG|nr:hypothetical protein FBU59_000377 [Linderina macrospora]
MQALSIASQEQLPGEPPFVAQQTPSQLSPHATGAYGQLSMQQILQSNVPSTPVITGNSTINSIVDEQNKAIMKAMSKIREDTTLDDLYAQARLESPGLATGNHDVDKLIAQLKTKYATNGPNFDTSSLNPQQPGDVDVESIIAQFDTNYATNGPGFDTSTFDPQQLGDAVQEAFGMLLGGI